MVAGDQVLEKHRGAEHDPAAGIDVGRVDDLQRADLALEFHDAAFDEALPLPSRLVLGVFRQVALFARLLDRLNDRRPLDGFQPLQFGLQALGAGGGDRNRHCRIHPKKNAPTQPGQFSEL